MKALRARPFMHFGAGIAVTVAAAWSLSSWQASASVSADESTFVSVSPTRVLDTRTDLGLAGPFVSADPAGPAGSPASRPPPRSAGRRSCPTVRPGVILNVTAVSPSAAGFVSIRPADAPGAPTTSNLNFKAGDIIPNSVTVQVPTSGADAGKIEITYDAFGNRRPDDRDPHRHRRLHQERRPRQPPGPGQRAPGHRERGHRPGRRQHRPDRARPPSRRARSRQAPSARAEIAAGAINNTHIVNNSLTVDNLGPNSVGTSELINGTVGLSEMNAVIVEDESIDCGATWWPKATVQPRHPD